MLDIIKKTGMCWFDTCINWIECWISVKNNESRNRLHFNWIKGKFYNEINAVDDNSICIWYQYEFCMNHEMDDTHRFMVFIYSLFCIHTHYTFIKYKLMEIGSEIYINNRVRVFNIHSQCNAINEPPLTARCSYVWNVKYQRDTNTFYAINDLIPFDSMKIDLIREYTYIFRNSNIGCKWYDL